MLRVSLVTAFRKIILEPIARAAIFRELGAYWLGTHFYEENTCNDTEMQLITQHVRTIITRAYRDMGFLGPIYIKLSNPGLPSVLHTSVVGTFSAFDRNLKNSAFVIINESFLKDYLDEEIYAVAGHEAAHSVYEHGRLTAYAIALSLTPTSFMRKISSQLAFLPAVFFSYLYFSRSMEKDADIKSAKTLGTSAALISSLEKSLENTYNKLVLRDWEFDVRKTMVGRIAYDIIIHDPHPHTATRIEYLKCLRNPDSGSPLLFKPKMHALLSEREILTRKQIYSRANLALKKG